MSSARSCSAPAPPPAPSAALRHLWERTRGVNERSTQRDTRGGTLLRLFQSHTVTVQHSLSNQLNIEKTKAVAMSFRHRRLKNNNNSGFFVRFIVRGPYRGRPPDDETVYREHFNFDLLQPLVNSQTLTIVLYNYPTHRDRTTDTDNYLPTLRGGRSMTIADR